MLSMMNAGEPDCVACPHLLEVCAVILVCMRPKKVNFALIIEHCID